MAIDSIAAVTGRIQELQTALRTLDGKAATASGADSSSGSDFASLLDGLSGTTSRLSSSALSSSALSSSALYAQSRTGGSAQGQRAVQAALSKLGTPYVWGAGRNANPTNFDCSGLTYWAWRQQGVSIGGTTYTQKNDGIRVASYEQTGKPVSPDTVRRVAQPGDLILCRATGDFTPGEPEHVVMYIGNGQVVHAPRTGDVVKVESIDKFDDIMYVQRPVAQGGSPRW